MTDIELGVFAQLLNISETELVWGTASPATEETMKALENVKVRYARSDVAKAHSRATQKSHEAHDSRNTLSD